MMGLRKTFEAPDIPDRVIETLEKKRKAVIPDKKLHDGLTILLTGHIHSSVDSVTGLVLTKGVPMSRFYAAVNVFISNTLSDEITKNGVFGREQADDSTSLFIRRSRTVGSVVSCISLARIANVLFERVCTMIDRISTQLGGDHVSLYLVEQASDQVTGAFLSMLLGDQVEQSDSRYARGVFARVIRSRLGKTNQNRTRRGKDGRTPEDNFERTLEENLANGPEKGDARESIVTILEHMINETDSLDIDNDCTAMAVMAYRIVSKQLRSADMVCDLEEDHYASTAIAIASSMSADARVPDKAVFRDNVPFSLYAYAVSVVDGEARAAYEHFTKKRAPQPRVPTICKALKSVVERSGCVYHSIYNMMTSLTGNHMRDLVLMIQCLY